MTGKAKKTRVRTAASTSARITSAIPQHTRNVRQEDLSHIPHETFRDAIVAPSLRVSLQEIIKLIHLDPNRPYNVNAYVASPEAMMGLCHARGKWVPMQARQVALLVLTNAASVMCEHNDEPYEFEYDDEQTERFEEFFDRLEKDNVALEDTLKTLAEGKEIVERIHGLGLAPDSSLANQESESYAIDPWASLRDEPFKEKVDSEEY